jgi:hypothetical protein
MAPNLLQRMLLVLTGCCPIGFHTEGHKGHEDKSFEQEEREAAEVKIKKRSLVKPRSGGNSIVRQPPDYVDSSASRLY